jgi:hypothetical protein
MSSTDSPVSATGTQVDIREHAAFGVPGWIAVLILAACVGSAVGLAFGPLPGLPAVPAAAFALIVSALVVVQPGETRVVQGGRVDHPAFGERPGA